MRTFKAIPFRKSRRILDISMKFHWSQVEGLLRLLNNIFQRSICHRTSLRTLQENKKKKNEFRIQARAQRNTYKYGLAIK